ncbi:MAG: anhydro-N-acetylmuramic acid kinase [Alphaproteobacteria bacterium]|nr:anhydro-N-acetylmuramic acid kinase [Alphaproteobacteria bacterium]
MRAVGLMSGTSMDGIDAALIETDGVAVARTGVHRTTPYDPAFRARLAAILGEGADADAVAAVEAELTRRHAEAVAGLLAAAGLAAAGIDLVGFHGHTIFHRPRTRTTRQIGDSAALARATGIDVIGDFRLADVAAGGEGAPFVPLYHAALAATLARPLAVLNLGGVGNLTWIGADGRILAFDTGPANALLDDWTLRHTGRPYDEGGRLAAAGTVDPARLAALTAHAYFARRPPKSLDRTDFGLDAVAGLGAADGAATLAAFTVQCVAAARAHLPAPARRWLVTGGGRLNPVLVQGLRDALGVAVDPVEAEGWDGDALEAEAFAFLAVRSRLGLPLSLPETTGVPRPMPGGRLYRAPRAAA